MNAIRIHLAIHTTDLGKAVQFYRTMFGVEPVKLREQYAKFSVASPPVNFTLNEVAQTPGHHGAEHFGIEVEDTDTVAAMQARLAAAGIATAVEDDVTCCYAKQDKVWANDPDGHRWEVFFVKEDADSYGKSIPNVSAEPSDQPCCAPSCCK